MQYAFDIKLFYMQSTRYQRPPSAVRPGGPLQALAAFNAGSVSAFSELREPVNGHVGRDFGLALGGEAVAQDAR